VVAGYIVELVELRDQALELGVLLLELLCLLLLYFLRAYALGDVPDYAADARRPFVIVYTNGDADRKTRAILALSVIDLLDVAGRAPPRKLSQYPQPVTSAALEQIRQQQLNVPPDNLLVGPAEKLFRGGVHGLHNAAHHDNNDRVRCTVEDRAGTALHVHELNLRLLCAGNVAGVQQPGRQLGNT